MSVSLAARARRRKSASAVDDLVPVPVGALEIGAAADGRALKLSLVIPTFNERENLRRLVQRLTDLLEEPLAGDYELIVVDDNSPDGTWAAARRLRSEFPRLRVMRRTGERGLSTAVLRGWQAARGELLAVIDADPKHPPELLRALLRQLEHGADLAIASRSGADGGASGRAVHRSILSRLVQALGMLVLPEVIGRISDPLSACFVVRRSSITGVRMSPPSYEILVELLARGRIRQIAEVGYVLRERLPGESRMTWRLCVDYLRHLLRLRLDSI